MDALKNIPLFEKFEKKSIRIIKKFNFYIYRRKTRSGRSSDPRPCVPKARSLPLDQVRRNLKDDEVANKANFLQICKKICLRKK